MPGTPGPEEHLIDAAAPSPRPGGGVLGAARHRARELRTTHPWPPIVEVHGCGVFEVLSAWVLSYDVGDFAALHTDRPDSSHTALRVVDGSPDPIHLCPDLCGTEDEVLADIARRDPFRAGTLVGIPRDGCLLVSTTVPHHRPPATSRFSVLSISLRVVA